MRSYCKAFRAYLQEIRLSVATLDRHADAHPAAAPTPWSVVANVIERSQVELPLSTEVVRFVDGDAIEQLECRRLPDGLHLVVGTPFVTRLAAFGDIVATVCDVGGRRFDSTVNDAGSTTYGCLVLPASTPHAVMNRLRACFAIVRERNGFLSVTAPPEMRMKVDLALRDLARRGHVEYVRLKRDCSAAQRRSADARHRSLERLAAI